jgi:hypothetical protein
LNDEASEPVPGRLALPVAEPVKEYDPEPVPGSFAEPVAEPVKVEASEAVAVRVTITCAHSIDPHFREP